MDNRPENRRDADSDHPKTGDRWGPWTYEKETDVLVHDVGYEVDLDPCRGDPVETLDWIGQVLPKTWADEKTVASLVAALDFILHFQAGF